ncbi:UNKNOWN [Stylonychia lemnae]|uniref:F-BAR domain-containing protein n=1 Tax=Stylonychia lemnae TaxID=5949 RepID=A0A078A9R3_STYLE|nr:UNKNOWN [Stylonychia lemnae]|eukprot:CDW78919.1 UNKNOWN [Stylonychia lemnae]
MNNLSFSTSFKESPLYQFYHDFEVQRNFYHQRKKEIEELVILFQDRVEAEKIYAARLQKIAQNKLKSITIGKLSEEIDAFKLDCKSKAFQAEELAENMQHDCISMLKEIVNRQEELSFNQKMEGRILISNLHDFDTQVKQKATAYFRAAKDAEESVVYYEENAKYSIELKYQQKQFAFEHMIGNLKKAKEKESQYKEVIDNANSYLLEFRTKIESLCEQLKQFESERCENVHSAINKFVVYEMSAEMNNKYDVNNFSKLLEEYKNEEELMCIYKYLFPNYDPSQILQTQSHEDDANNQNDNRESPSKKKYKLNLKFQFAPYESKKINVFQIQGHQLTPPREKITQYSNNQDLMKFIVSRIFTEVLLHEEYYLTLNKQFKTQEGRTHFLNILERRFNLDSKVLLGKNSFQNLKEALDVFLFESNKENDIENAARVINYLDVFYLKNGAVQTKENQNNQYQIEGAQQISNMQSGSLKFAIKDHSIWKEDKVWKKMIQQGLEFVNLKNSLENVQNKDEETKRGDEIDQEQETNTLRFQVIEKVINEMIAFQVPSPVVKLVLQENEHVLRILEASFQSLQERVHQYILKRDQEAQPDQKRKPQAQKGIPDWLQELYDPFEGLISTSSSQQQFSARDSVARNLAMTFKDLIKPKQSFGESPQQYSSTDRSTDISNIANNESL